MTHYSDEDLQRLLSSPSERRRAFGLIVAQYSSKIYWQIRRMVHSHDDADDLVQNTFLKAWEGIDGFRGDARISTWLYRIALYEALNHLKKQKRENEVQVHPQDDERMQLLMANLESDVYFDGDDYEKAFQKALATLPEKQQLVFRLRYYDELPYEQISTLTGTSTGALKASYHHAYKKMVELLKKEEEQH